MSYLYCRVLKDVHKIATVLCLVILYITDEIRTDYVGPYLNKHIICRVTSTAVKRTKRCFLLE